ncbi:MAG TPA: FAD-dependent oxidoreductase, partial [Roseimicrobium sp.]|nr:FAD-dependent oxidoreductase [Roseimicrobium sp.]
MAWRLTIFDMPPLISSRTFCSLAATVLLLGGALSVHAAERSYDVLVYGGTPAGVTAAVAAAREGAKVAIVEPLPVLGGIMSGGLGFSDSNQTDRESLRG